MISDVKFVCGCSYGDEGKGVMSNYYTRIAKQNGHSVLNVLYNGGAQRGHTAQGHVFHCFGAGATRGADTYYTRNFMFNPIAWWFEFKELNQEPMLYVNANCRITTPYDVRINQLLEESRGNKRHGSCGLGIFETRKRSEEIGGLRAADLTDSRTLYCALKNIKDNWVPTRCKELGIEYSNNNPYEFDNFISCVEQMLKSGKVKICDDNIMLNYDTIIFEGGQGLLLSETNAIDFPHLTPSVTEYRGAKDELEYLYDNTNARFEFCLMTRPYLTRHGAGPLPNECPKEEISDKIVDETNMPNEWQGNLRFAPLNSDVFMRIHRHKDLLIFLPDDPKRISFSIGITCLDQSDGYLMCEGGYKDNIDDRFKIPYTSIVDKSDYHKCIYAFFGKDTLPIISL